MNITENNKIIAEFMGWENEKFNDILFYYTLDGCLDENSLKFHSDWNWLMSVVEKIRFKTDCAFFNFDDWQSLINAIEICLLNLSIKDTYSACIEYINWYNENK